MLNSVYPGYATAAVPRFTDPPGPSGTFMENALDTLFSNLCFNRCVADVAFILCLLCDQYSCIVIFAWDVRGARLFHIFGLLLASALVPLQIPKSTLGPPPGAKVSILKHISYFSEASLLSWCPGAPKIHLRTAPETQCEFSYILPPSDPKNHHSRNTKSKLKGISGLVKSIRDNYKTNSYTLI